MQTFADAVTEPAQVWHVRLGVADDQQVVAGGRDDELVAARPNRTTALLVAGRQKVAVSGAVSVELGRGTSCAALKDGNVWCWGSNSHGWLGNDNYSPSYKPVRVLSAKKIVP